MENRFKQIFKTCTVQVKSLDTLTQYNEWLSLSKLLTSAVYEVVMECISVYWGRASLYYGANKSGLNLYWTFFAHHFALYLGRKFKLCTEIPPKDPLQTPEDRERKNIYHGNTWVCSFNTNSDVVFSLCLMHEMKSEPDPGKKKKGSPW